MFSIFIGEDICEIRLKSLKKARDPEIILQHIAASELSQLDYEVMDAAVRAGRPNEAWARLEESEVRICIEDEVLHRWNDQERRWFQEKFAHV